MDDRHFLHVIIKKDVYGLQEHTMVAREPGLKFYSFSILPCPLKIKQMVCECLKKISALNGNKNQDPDDLFKRIELLIFKSLKDR